MREWVDPTTGEIFACVALATWERLVRIATQVAPCGAPELGKCGSPGCALAAAVLVESAAE